MNKKTKNIFLIDIAVPNTHNLAKTITDKQNKYQELANEICAMWKQKAAQVIPIVISSTGVIPKSLSQSLTRLTANYYYYWLLRCDSRYTCRYVPTFQRKLLSPSSGWYMEAVGSPENWCLFTSLDGKTPENSPSSLPI